MDSFRLRLNEDSSPFSIQIHLEECNMSVLREIRGTFRLTPNSELPNLPLSLSLKAFSHSRHVKLARSLSVFQDNNQTLEELGTSIIVSADDLPSKLANGISECFLEGNQLFVYGQGKDQLNPGIIYIYPFTFVLPPGLPPTIQDLRAGDFSIGIEYSLMLSVPSAWIEDYEFTTPVIVKDEHNHEMEERVVCSKRIFVDNQTTDCRRFMRKLLRSAISRNLRTCIAPQFRLNLELIASLTKANYIHFVVRAFWDPQSVQMMETNPIKKFRPRKSEGKTQTVAVPFTCHSAKVSLFGELKGVCEDTLISFQAQLKKLQFDLYQGEILERLPPNISSYDNQVFQFKIFAEVTVTIEGEQGILAYQQQVLSSRLEIVI